MALKRIQDLDPAAALDGSELVELEQGGASVQCTTQDIADLADGGIADAPIDGKTYARKDGDWDEIADGSGDVVGPASSTAGNFAVFDDTTGKLLDDGGVPGAMAFIDDAPSDGTGYVRKDGAWAAESGGGPTAYTIITEAGASTATVGTNDGLFRYNRCGGDVTFDNAQPYTAGMVFNIRATAGLDLVESGVTLTPPAGGTLELDAGMAVQVVMTSSTTADVIGQTVAA